MHLPSILPLRSPPGALSGPPCPLLSPWLGPPTVGVDHLPHTLRVVVVDSVVLALPHHVLVDDVHPGVDREHVRVELHDLGVLPRVETLHPDLPWLSVLHGDLVNIRQVCLVGHRSGLAQSQGGAANLKLYTGGGQ